MTISPDVRNNPPLPHRQEHHVDTFCARILLTTFLHFNLLVALATNASANNSDDEQQPGIDQGNQTTQRLANEPPQPRSLLKIFELENTPNGSRSDVRTQERSARLQLNEELSSEQISTRNSQIKTTATQEQSLFRDSPIMRRQRKFENSKLIKSKLLTPSDPFAIENPPVRRSSMHQQPDSVFEPVRKKAKTEEPAPNLDNGELQELDLSQDGEVTAMNRIARRSASHSMTPGSHQQGTESIDSEFHDAYTDELPAKLSSQSVVYSPHIQDTIGYRHQPPTTQDQNEPQAGWQTTPDRGTSSSSVSAIMTPRIRHTDNGIEVNFSDTDTGIYPIKEESPLEDAPTSTPPIIPPRVWENQPQYQQQYQPQEQQTVQPPEQQPVQQGTQQPSAQPVQQQDDQEVPSWDSILKGGDPPVQNDTEIETEQPDVEEPDNIVDSIDELPFGGDETDAALADDAIQSASEIQSIEKQREGYRQALRQKLSNTPVQRIFQYLDDEGEMLPASDDQRFYLLEFNSYRYSRLYNNECRIDSLGNSYCRTHALWLTPDLCYNPLYFEEVNLERFGGRYPYVQPVISAAHFFSSVATLPYQMGAQPPHCCYYSAGYGRPGNKYCYQMKRPVWSLRGATLQSLLITGLVFGLP